MNAFTIKDADAPKVLVLEENEGDVSITLGEYTLATFIGHLGVLQVHACVGETGVTVVGDDERIKVIDDDDEELS